MQLALNLDRQLLNFINLYRKFNNREGIPLEDDINALLAYGVGKLLKVDELKDPAPNE